METGARAESASTELEGDEDAQPNKERGEAKERDQAEAQEPFRVKRTKIQVVEARTYHDGALVTVHVRGPNPSIPSKCWWFQWSRSSAVAPWQLTWDGREATWAAWHLGKVIGPSQKRFRRHYVRKHKVDARKRRQEGTSSSSTSSVAFGK